MSNYELDYVQWAEQQSKLLKARKFELLDVINLAEEIESLGKNDKRKLESLLTRLFEHLLKRKHTGMQECYRGWDIEIRNFSKQIIRLLKDSPSLKNYLTQITPSCYQEAIESVTQDYEICDFSPGLDVEEIIENLKNKNY